MLRRAGKTNKQEDWNHYSNAKCRTANIIKRSKPPFFVSKLTKMKKIPKVLECSKTPKWLRQTND